MAGKQSSVSVDKAVGASHRSEALYWRQQGLTFEEIGHKLNLSGERARVLVKKEIEKLHESTTDMAVVIKMSRLQQIQELIKEYLVPAMLGDVKALDCVLKMMDRESKFLGMDAPTKTQIQGVTNSYDDMSLEELKEEARRRGMETREIPEAEVVTGELEYKGPTPVDPHQAAQGEVDNGQAD